MIWNFPSIFDKLCVEVMESWILDVMVVLSDWSIKDEKPHTYCHKWVLIYKKLNRLFSSKEFPGWGSYFTVFFSKASLVSVSEFQKFSRPARLRILGILQADFIYLGTLVKFRLQNSWNLPRICSVKTLATYHYLNCWLAYLLRWIQE